MRNRSERNKSARPQIRDRTLFGSDQRTVIDVVLAGVAAVIGLADLVFDIGQNGTTFTWATAAIVMVVSASLIVRRSYAVPVFVLASVCRLAVAAAADTEVALSLHGAAALYTVARQRSRKDSLGVGLIGSIVAAATIAIVSPGALIEETIAEVMIVLVVLAVAEVARTNQARTDERVAAETAERVHVERLRIARDLHDVVAHGLANITVQSGIAARLVHTDPDHAQKALEIINDAGRDSLDELRSLLGLLRTRDDEVETHPTPGRPADLQTLIGNGTEAGLKIKLTEYGEFPPDTSNAVVVAGYRIVQESLTNISRHAGAVPVELELRHEDDHVSIQITNESGWPEQAPLASTGVGIIGMTERAEAVGGTLSARPLDDGRFQVHARLPHRNPEPEEGDSGDRGAPG